MKKDNDDYELREEYDLSQLPIMPKGRYAPECDFETDLHIADLKTDQSLPDNL